MAVIQKPVVGGYGTVVVFAACAVGFMCGGFLDHWMTGSGRSFGAFGAAFGMTVGGLIGAASVEFLLPFAGAALALGASNPAPPPAALATPAEERLSVAGQLLRGVMVVLAVLAGIWLVLLGTGPVARGLALAQPLAGLLLVAVALAMAGVAAAAGGALARNLDLTVP